LAHRAVSLFDSDDDDDVTILASRHANGNGTADLPVLTLETFTHPLLPPPPPQPSKLPADAKPLNAPEKRERRSQLTAWRKWNNKKLDMFEKAQKALADPSLAAAAAVSMSGSSNGGGGDDSDADDDEPSTTGSGAAPELRAHVPIASQVYRVIHDSGSNGVFATDICRLLGLPARFTETVLNVLRAKLGVVGTPVHRV
jgi:hypothetical protein